MTQQENEADRVTLMVWNNQILSDAMLEWKIKVKSFFKDIDKR